MAVSVEVFCFCSDAARVTRWWQLPLRELDAEMELFQDADDSYIGPFLVPDLMGLSVFAPLQELREARDYNGGSAHTLLEDTLRELATERQRVAPRRLLAAFRPTERAALRGLESRIKTLCQLYHGLHQVAHVGPHCEPTEIRNYSLLAEQLERVMPPAQAVLYENFAGEAQSQLAPPELLAALPQLSLEIGFQDTLALGVLDAPVYCQRWDNEVLARFWDEWQNTPDGELLVPHFRAAGEVARYAVQHQTPMLQCVC